jgi:anti-sigma regulatory factor (Ser/Thr protein kinase)
VVQWIASWRLELVVDVASVREARRFAEDFARHEHLDGLSDALLLVTSELVSNAIRYANRSITLLISRGLDDVRVAVADDGDGEPALLDPDHFSESGRGLVIVDALARSWGSRRSAKGKVVWAELADAS